MWNEITYEHRQQYFRDKLTEESVKVVWERYYWKYRDLGRRIKRIVVRNDRYYLEPANNGEDI